MYPSQQNSQTAHRLRSVTEAPIFIVGVPRSGTTLLAAILASHSRISCGPETHFFRWLSKNEIDGFSDHRNWPESAVNFIQSITFTNYVTNEKLSLLKKYKLETEQVNQYLASREPSIPNILSSVTELYMQSLGKRRWAEKTPDHIIQVKSIRKYFPNSPIIRIVRDPRDVALSLVQMPWGAQSFVEALLFWNKFEKQSQHFFLSDKLSYTLRYEDLITDPIRELTDLCQFIGEDFEENMLNTSNMGMQINSMNVPWKDMVSKPIDATRIELWRKKITVEENLLAEAIIGDRIEAYNYPRDASFSQLGEILPALTLTIKYRDAFTSNKIEGVRFWKIKKDEKPSVKLFLGDPNLDNWLTYNKIQRFFNTISLIANIIYSIFTKKTLFWYTLDEYEGKWPGYSAYLLKRLLTPYKFLI